MSPDVKNVFKKVKNRERERERRKRAWLLFVLFLAILYLAVVSFIFVSVLLACLINCKSLHYKQKVIFDDSAKCYFWQQSLCFNLRFAFIPFGRKKSILILSINTIPNLQSNKGCRVDILKTYWNESFIVLTDKSE